MNCIVCLDAEAEVNEIGLCPRCEHSTARLVDDLFDELYANA